MEAQVPSHFAGEVAVVFLGFEEGLIVIALIVDVVNDV
jgi:hypothetical protein